MRHIWSKLSVDAHYDLRKHLNIVVVGTLDQQKLEQLGKAGDVYYRPRAPYRPGQHESAVYDVPKDMQGALSHIYNTAVRDMRKRGEDAAQCYLYVLVHSATLAPDDCLRGGDWHFDLQRLARVTTANDELPVAVNYAISTSLPTQFATALHHERALPARATFRDDDMPAKLGELAVANDAIFQPEAGAITRYDTLTLHRGTTNTAGHSRHRAFIHLAFSPVAL